MVGVDRLDRRQVRLAGAGRIAGRPTLTPPRCGSPPAPPGRPRAARWRRAPRSSAARSARWVTIRTGASSRGVLHLPHPVDRDPRRRRAPSPPAPAPPARPPRGTAGSRPPRAPSPARAAAARLAAGRPNGGMTSPRAMSMMSPTIAEAVGPAPAPGPLITIRPTKSPSITTMLVTPVSCPAASPPAPGRAASAPRAPLGVIRATPSSWMR